MPAAIIGAVVAAGATAYSAYSSANAPGVPDNSTAKTLNTEQKQLAQLQTQLIAAQKKQDAPKIASIQQQISNLKLVLAAQTNTLANQAGNLPAVQTPTPVVNISGVNKNVLWIAVALVAAAIGYLFFRKK